MENRELALNPEEMPDELEENDANEVENNDDSNQDTQVDDDNAMEDLDNPVQMTKSSK